MLRAHWRIAGLVIGLIAAGGWLYSWLQDAMRVRKVRVGYSLAVPYSLQGAGGEPAGLAVDVLRQAAVRAGIEIEWVFFDGVLDAGLAGTGMDLWAQGNLTEERSRRFHATEPWLTTDYHVAWQPAGDEVLPHLEGRALAVRGLPHVEALARQSFPGAQLKTFHPAAALAALCRGENVGAVVAEYRMMVGLLEKRPADCLGHTLRTRMIPGGHVPVSIFARKHAAWAAEALRLEIGRMAIQDELRPYFEKWGVALSEEAKMSRLLDRLRGRQYLLGACVLVLVGLLGASVQLIRDLRLARLESEKANQAKSAFLANMSHEIRTPLNGVLGMNSLMLGSGLNSEQSEWAQAIQTSGQSLLTVLNDILDLAKIEAGSFRLEESVFDLARLANDCVMMFRGQAHLKGLQIDCLLPAGGPRWVTGDATRVRQILTNYLGNAVKFTETGFVRLEVSASTAGRVRFAVVDSGPGIPAAQQAKLFQRFMQADDSTTRQHGGTGLGLAICRELADRMGGAAGMTSEMGQGSEFWVELPLAEAPAPVHQAEAANPGMTPLPGLRVLVAEDNAVNQRVIGNWLRKFDCSFHTVANGQLALDALRQSEFDLVLMDCHMPVLDGYQALEQIRQSPALRGKPVVALTANAMAGERERGLALGFDDYLTKPVDPKLLWAALARYQPVAA